MVFSSTYRWLLRSYGVVNDQIFPVLLGHMRRNSG